MTFPEFGIISNNLANSFSSDLIPHLHGRGSVGGGGGVFCPGVVSTCFIYYQYINLQK